MEVKINILCFFWVYLLSLCFGIRDPVANTNDRPPFHKSKHRVLLVQTFHAVFNTHLFWSVFNNSNSCYRMFKMYQLRAHVFIYNLAWYTKAIEIFMYHLCLFCVWILLVVWIFWKWIYSTIKSFTVP